MRKLTDGEIALKLLTQDYKGDSEQAATAFARDPVGIQNAMRRRIDHERGLGEIRQKEEEAREFAASPEGREQAAKEAAERREALKARVELAKELLRDEQDTNGLSEDLISNLSDTDALALAGMVEDKPENTYEIETPSEASEELARHWTAWTEQQKREHIQRTGMTLEEVRAVAERRSKHSFS